ncbi:MAG TPA: protein adenylyltransferase SelO family protein, partial [Chryseobacterium sp.]
WQLANSLFPLVKDEKFLEETLNRYGNYFWEAHDKMLCKKFGFDELKKSDEEFFTNWQGLMQELEFDYTLFFNRLEKVDDNSNLENFFSKVSYGNLDEVKLQKLQHFIEMYQLRLKENTISKEESLDLMKKNNPKFILRNYLLFECIEELNIGKTEMLEKLIKALENPYQEIFPEFSVKRPSGYDDVSGCSMLSCSS